MLRRPFAQAKEFRDKISAIVTEKHHSTMSKLGAILGQGIIDAGGRNMALSLRSRAGFVKSTAVVGMAMFLQHWFWYPYMHFISLALAPTAIIGLDRTLQEPKAFSVTCHAKPSDFAYVRAGVLVVVLAAGLCLLLPFVVPSAAALCAMTRDHTILSRQPLVAA